MIFFLMAIQLRAQDVSGDWFGILDVGIAQLELVFHITQSDTGYTATMDSPDQNALGIPVSKVTFLPPELKMDVTNLGIFYEGSLKSDTIVGTFRQAGRDFPLDLYRDRIEKKVQVRPQEPIPPFPYYSEEVSFPNPEFDISLAGTLTLPDTNGIYPVAVLISGSGPQNRDEELLGHKPFLVLADFLTRNGIGVLRYDDRGVGQSTGDHEAANSADLATDAKSAVRYLKTRKEIDPDKIGLIGHSEGGLMSQGVQVVGLYVRDHDEALAFYVDKLGFKVHTDVRNGDYRWLTVQHPEQPLFQLGLFVPGPPVLDAATAEDISAIVAKGAMPPLVLAVDDCRATYEKLRVGGVEFTQEPIERFGNIDAGFRDPSGNGWKMIQTGKQS